MAAIAGVVLFILGALLIALGIGVPGWGGIMAPGVVFGACGLLLLWFTAKK